MRSSDPDKRCAFDETKTDQKCIYIHENDTCLMINNYTTCEEYKGTDRAVCESIISPTTNASCVFEKDSICKERDSVCSQIRNNHIKYCAYIYNRYCSEEYKYCENITNLGQCESNFPQNYFSHERCVIKDDKCVTSESCSTFFSEYDFQYLCQNNYNCTFSYDYKCTKKKELTCSGTKFSSQGEENMDVCSSIQVSNPNKVCVLKADKSGCEEVLKHETTPYYNGTSDLNTGSSRENSSEFMTKGFNLIIVMIALLI